MREEELPLPLELLDDRLGGEVEVDLGRGEAVVPEEALKGWERDVLLDGGHREGVPQHMGSDRA